MCLVREFYFGSSEYQSSLNLREQILRIPLGLKLTKEELLRDVNDIHMGAFIDDRLCGCLILSQYELFFKMRQVAIAEAFQRQGLGQKLVAFAEAYSRRNKIFKIELSARELAVSFYLGLGYKCIGENYLEKSIPHIKMFKKLQLTSTDQK